MTGCRPDSKKNWQARLRPCKAYLGLAYSQATPIIQMPTTYKHI